MYTGPHLIKDSLVFGYDTGYGVADNNTSTRFYPGEPTVNSLASTAVGSSGITFGSDSGGTYLETNSGTTGYNYIKIPNITVTSNETYTWSFELKSTETITQSGNKYYFDTNEYSNEFSTSNDQSRVSSSQIRPSSLPANEWVKFALTVTMKPNLTGAYAYDFLNFIKPHFTSKKIYYRNMQFEHNKSHHTPFVAGTRSSTQSLIDLKRTADIDVSNVSFDSTGQPTFDGTDDYAYINPISINVGSGISFEAVYSAESSYSTWGTYHYLLKFVGSTHYGLLHEGDSRGWRMDIPSSTGTRKGATTNSPNATAGAGYYHVAVSYDPVTGGKGYLNGEEIGSWQGGYTAFTPTGLIIGAESTSNRFWNGDIPLVRVYNRSLSAQEVKQNFNAYKNRFDI